MSKKMRTHLTCIAFVAILCACLTACSEDELNSVIDDVQDLASTSNNNTASSSVTYEEPLTVIDTVTYIPTLSEDSVAQSQYIWIDDSNSSQGYIMVQYLGDHTGKVKFQITGPDQITYTFSMEAGQDFQTFPLTGGSGTYTLNTFEQDSGTSYYTVDSTTITVTLESEWITYLYPNQFVDYDQNSSVIALSVEAATDVYSEIDLIASIYNTVMDTLEYDEDIAEAISSGGLTEYIPDLDEIIATEKGICFDYASLMVAMLRIQGMPAKLVIGYAGEAYHAWINVYTEEDGWINEVICFNGEEWALMDPTFADNSQNNSTINDFIGDGTNYTEKYVY